LSNLLLAGNWQMVDVVRVGYHGTSAGSILARVAARWQTIDPLLPAPTVRTMGCNAELVVAGPAADTVALGICEHCAWTPTSFDLSWGRARRFELNTRVAGHDVATALDTLLTLWRDHLAGVPGADAKETVAVVTWPSRDIEGAATLLRRGFAPLAVIAVREISRHREAPITGNVRQAADCHDAANLSAADTCDGAIPNEPRIRRAMPADIDTVVDLGLDVLRFDAHFGVVTERPGMADALRREADGLLAGPEPWTWLAERDGRPIGMLSAQRPESASRVAPMVRPAPAAYTMLLDVLPGERGSGVGAALVARLHYEAEAAGVAVTLLRYEQLNPLSAPFWSRQGYRPLWTLWEVRPARTIR
jgi:GNAT superfamily N-acetyltransferase